MFKRALISVSNKSGLQELAAGLQEHSPQCEILSTGGTAKKLGELGLQPREISDYTGFEECFAGRVKTLHPKVHGGILFRRGTDDEEAQKMGIAPIDLVVVNLYPFEKTYREGRGDLVEMIDIGGPTLLRAAAKNADSVIVLCDPSDYDEFLERLAQNKLDADYRKKLRSKVFARTASYDAAIAAALNEEAFPESLTLSFKRKNSLRYGENPHQSAAVYSLDCWEGGLAGYHLHQGKELSYNNLLDVAASVMPLSYDDGKQWCCVVKHAAPCGVASSEHQSKAFELAWAGDPVSAFGSVVAFSQAVDAEAAELVSKKFVEVVMAPSFTPEALELLSAKKNLRVVSVKENSSPVPQSFQQNAVLDQGIALFQQPNRVTKFAQIVKTEAPHGAPSQELVSFGLKVVSCLKSNAICLVRANPDGSFQSLGMGGGQPNRVQALGIAVDNARRHFGEEAMGQALLASDAFFPFPDNIEVAAAAGVKFIVAPGGSKKDGEVTEAAQRLGVSLTFVDHRLFRH